MTDLFIPNKVYTAEEIAVIMNMKSRKIRNLATEGKLPCILVDPTSERKYRLFKGEDLNNYFKVR